MAAVACLELRKGVEAAREEQAAVQEEANETARAGMSQGTVSAVDAANAGVTAGGGDSLGSAVATTESYGADSALALAPDQRGPHELALVPELYSDGTPYTGIALDFGDMPDLELARQKALDDHFASAAAVVADRVRQGIKPPSLEPEYLPSAVLVAVSGEDDAPPPLMVGAGEATLLLASSSEPAAVSSGSACDDKSGSTEREGASSTSQSTRNSDASNSSGGVGASDAASGPTQGPKALSGIEHLFQDEFSSEDGACYRPVAPAAPWVRDPLGSPAGTAERLAELCSLGAVAFWQRDLAVSLPDPACLICFYARSV